MTLLHWKSEYALGIPSVDHEHREMIGKINEVYAHMEGSSAPDAIESCLEDIYAGIALHFALEERHMREAGYDEYLDHKDDHEDLLDELLNMMDRYAEDPQAGRQLLEQKLNDWFANHFATFDARLHNVLGRH